MWLACGALAAVAAVIAGVLVVRARPAAPSDAAAIAEFRATERRCLTAFNDALHRQARGEIDELALAEAIDRDVLPAWRAMRSHVEAAAPTASPAHRALFAALHDYLGDRQTAWEAFSAALRAPSDEAARPHYATYRARDAAAQRDAQIVAPLLPH